MSTRRKSGPEVMGRHGSGISEIASMGSVTSAKFFYARYLYDLLFLRRFREYGPSRSGGLLAEISYVFLTLLKETCIGICDLDQIGWFGTPYMML